MMWLVVSSIKWCCLLFCMKMVLTLTQFPKYTSAQDLKGGGNSDEPCDIEDPKTCNPGYCCIKEVTSFEDLDNDPHINTVCHAHLAIGELCLRQPEGYLCDCASGLECDFRNNETYGHCVLSS